MKKLFVLILSLPLMLVLQAEPARSVSVLLFPEDATCMAPLLAPLAANQSVNHPDEICVPLAISSTTPGLPSIAPNLKVARYFAAGIAADEELPDNIDSSSLHYICGIGQPEQNSLELLKHYTNPGSRAWLARSEDTEAIILASALAAHHGEALLLFSELTEDDQWLGEVVAAGIRSLAYVTSSGEGGKTILIRENLTARTWSIDAAARLLPEIIGRDKVKNIILTRTPEEYEVSTALLAPWWSWYRKAPLIFSRSRYPEQIEAQVWETIDDWKIQPRSLTIFGDDYSIGTIEQKIPTQDRNDFYFVEAEPCMFEGNDQASCLGVGRIPFTYAAPASSLLARIYVKENLPRVSPPSVLLISNPPSDHGTLPLCETVNRLSARDLKNCGIRVNDYYGKEAATEKAIKHAGTSDVILYNGHVVDCTIFHEAIEYPEDPPRLTPPDPRIDEFDRHEIEVARWIGPVGAEKSSMGKLPAVEMPEIKVLPDFQSAASRLSLIEVPLERFPTVLLQSCSSLDLTTFERIMQLGGTGLIGSVTSIHSASGSSYIKAFTDESTYGNKTIGEAMRDARNYFLALARLKELRGHTEQAKARRVACSFQFWGDPECRLFGNFSCSPQSDYLKGVRDSGSSDVKIKLPGNYLPKVETEKYAASMCPNVRTAGIVRKLKEGELSRRLVPLYFFQLPAGKNPDLTPNSILFSSQDKSPRTTILRDRFDRSAWVLHMPGHNRKHGEVILKTFSQMPEHIKVTKAEAEISKPMSLRALLEN